MNSRKSAPLKNSEMSSVFKDPIVSEVRAARHALAEAQGNDLQRIANDLMLRQTQLGRRLLTSQKQEEVDR